MKVKATQEQLIENIDRSEKTWVLDTQKLEPGDIVLSTTRCFISVGIRKLSRSDYSHAALHIGGGFLIEAVGHGVRRIHARDFQYLKPARMGSVTNDSQECKNGTRMGSTRMGSVTNDSYPRLQMRLVCHRPHFSHLELKTT